MTDWNPNGRGGQESRRGGRGVRALKFLHVLETGMKNMWTSLVACNLINLPALKLNSMQRSITDFSIK